MAINKAKLKTLTRLSDRGFDTHKKILAIDMRAARNHGLDDDIGGIIDLQDAIKAHREIAYLCDGSDAKPRERRDSMCRKGETIEVNSREELKKLIDEIPEGTVYSITMEVVLTNEQDQRKTE